MPAIAQSNQCRTRQTPFPGARRCVAPNRVSRTHRRLVVFVAIVALSVAATRADDAFKPLAPGVEYRHEVRSAGPQSIHVLRIGRQQKWDVQTGLGKGTVCGLESLSGIVRRVGATVKKPAVAAINGDFYLIKRGPNQGDPSGLQIMQGELVSGPGGGTSFWIATNGEPRIGRVEARFRVIWPDGKTQTSIGINETRRDDGAVLYTAAFGLQPDEPPKEAPTTRTRGGKEFVLGRMAGQPWSPIRPGKTYSLKILEVRNVGGSALQADKAILSLGPGAPAPAAKAGDVVQVVMETNPSLDGVRTAIGGGRTLITGGRSPDLGPAKQPRHPRSMVGWNDRHLFLMVVDGRRSSAIGMTYPEMAALAKEHGCTEAFELDGGGSSTLWAGKVLNSPSDGRPRALANALILFRGR